MTATIGPIALVVLTGCPSSGTLDAADAGSADVATADAAGDGEAACEENARRCVERDVEECVGGAWSYSATCDKPNFCIEGACRLPCDLAGLEWEKSYVGCEFMTVQTNVSGAPDLTFRLVFANVFPSGEVSVAVDIYAYVAGEEMLVAEVDVPPSDVAEVILGPAMAIGSLVEPLAFRVVASAPISAYQFNPADNAFSNDASLLLPVHTLGTDYVAMVYPGPSSSGGEQYLSVVGTTDGTTVTITPTTEVEAGGPVPGGTAPFDISLERYDVLNVQTFPAANPFTAPAVDLSGTRIVADQPVAVFSGNVCVNIPNNVGACDHTEEQLLPLTAWGVTYVAARTTVRRPGDPEPVYWQIVAGDEDVDLSFRPATPEGAPTELTAFQVARFSTTASFILGASGRVQIMQWMPGAFIVGSSSLGGCTSDDDCDGFGFLAGCASVFDSCKPFGDPSAIIVPPAEQFRTDYVFQIPDDFAVDYVTIAAPGGTSVLLDGSDVLGFELIGDLDGTEYTRANVSVEPGAHVLSASDPVGLILEGLHPCSSYGTIGGLNIRPVDLR
jgi:IgGFc binding protein